MSKKEEFKNFVRANPTLLKHVQAGSMDWQKFYEIYDMYGTNNEVWKEYLMTPQKEQSVDLANFFRGIDLDSIQNSVTSIQRVIGLIQDMSTNKTQINEYKPRPIYKHFED